MKFGKGSNTALTQKYGRVKVQNDIRTSKHINKHPQFFKLCYPCVSLTSLARKHLNFDGEISESVLLTNETIYIYICIYIYH